MQEYWINVYPGYIMGDKLPTQLIAAQRDGGASIYRIHVKIDGGWNKSGLQRAIEYGGKEIIKLIPEIYK